MIWEGHAPVSFDDVDMASDMTLYAMENKEREYKQRGAMCVALLISTNKSITV